MEAVTTFATTYAPQLRVAALALSAVGTGVSVMSAYAQGQTAKQTAEYNAKVADRNAVLARQQAAMDAETQDKEAKKRLGSIVAGYAASGVTLEGSPLDVLASSASEAERDRQTILYKGELKAMGYQSDAELDRFSGQAASTAGVVKAGSELLTGSARTVGFAIK